MAKPDLKLETKRASLALDDVEIDGSFSGYASVFGLADLGNDVIEKRRLCEVAHLAQIIGRANALATRCG